MGVVSGVGVVSASRASARIAVGRLAVMLLPMIRANSGASGPVIVTRWVKRLPGPVSSMRWAKVRRAIGSRLTSVKPPRG